MFEDMVQRALKFFDKLLKREKPAENKLLKPDEFLEAILENLPVMIFVKDARELRFVRFNKAGEELLGIPRSELIGKNDYDFFPKEQADFFTFKDREVLKGKHVLDIPEEPINTKLKGRRWLYTRKIPIVYINDLPQYLLGVSIDITEVKLASDRLRKFNIELEEKVKERTQEMEKANEQLTKVNRDLDSFIYAVSHDLKAPVANLEGLIQSLEASGEITSQENRIVLDLIVRSFNRLKETINDLTDLALAKRNITEEPEIISPAGIIEGVKQTLSEIILATHATLNVEIKFNGQIRFSAKDFRSIISNLLTNALKYHSPERQPVVDLSFYSEGEFLVLDVKDNGLGLNADQVKQIFSMFKRFHTHVEGTGLGLYLVKRIVENHDGKIEVTSEPGKGSDFRIYVKAACLPE